MYWIQNWERLLATDELFVFLLQIIDSPMSFLDTTPTGRLLNRFSKDQDEVETVLPLVMDSFLQCSLLVASTVVVISVIFPAMLVVGVIMAAFLAFTVLWVYAG